ncbi:MAG: SRPBCC domain-containing protein [Thermomicrobiales bacterium]
MKTLQYVAAINVPREKVWRIMLGPETYLQWTEAAWPGSKFTGDWSKGSEMKFGGEGGEGTIARIVTANPPEFISAEHIAIINEDGTEDRESDMAKSWIGTTESYTFREVDGGTELTVELSIFPEWTSMFDESWPVALQALKTLAEAS